MDMFDGGQGSLGGASGYIEIRTDEAQRSIKQLQGAVGSFASDTSGAFSRIATGVGLLGISKSIISGFAGMVGVASDLSTEMSAVAAALGGVGTEAGITQEQFDALNAAAIDIGGSTSKSAGEAAAAMTALARAGLDVATILDGGAMSAVALSEATGEGLTQSAETMASVLLLFQGTGLEAGRAADIIVSGMNASNASLSEFQTGLARLAPTIATTGTSFEEAAAAIAYFNSLGLSAEEAGTSLNAAILAISDPTGDAAAALHELGVVAFDAQGQFIGFPALFDQVQRGAAKFGSEQERIAVLTRAFGREALDVMSLAATNGSAALSDLETQMGVTGSAADAAATRMDNLAGDAEEFSGVLESISANIGQKIIPSFRELVQAATTIARGFAALPASFQVLAAGGVAASGAIAGVAGAMVLAGPRAAAFGDALRTIRVALLGMNPLLLVGIGAVALFAAAYRSNWGGIADATDRVIGAIREAVSSLGALWQTYRQIPDFGNIGAAFAALGIAFENLTGLDVNKQFAAIGKSANGVGVALGRITRHFRTLGRVIERGGLAAGIEAFTDSLGPKMLANIGKAIGTLPRTIGTAFGQIATGIGPLDSILANLGRGFDQFGRAIQNVFAGDIDKAVKNLRNMVGRLRNVGLTLGTLVISGAVALAGELADFAVDAWDWVRGNLSNIADAAITLGSLAVSAAVALAGELADIAGDVWGWVRGQFHNILDAALTLGTLAITGAISLSRTILDVASDTWGWITRQFRNVADASLQLGTILIDGSIDLAGALGDAIPDVWGWVKQHARNIYDSTLAVGTLAVTGTVEFTSSDDFNTTASGIAQGIVEAITGLASFGADIGSAIADKIKSVDWLGFATSGSFGTGEDVGAALRSFIVQGVKAIGEISAEDVADVFVKIATALGKGALVAPAALATAGVAMLSFFAGAIKGLIFGEGDIDWDNLVGSIVSTFVSALSSAREAITSAIAGLFTGTEAEATPGAGFTTATDGIFQSLGELDFSDIPFPSLPDWFTDFGWFTGPIDGLVDEIEKQIGRLSDAWDKLAFWKDRDPNFDPLAGVGGDRPTVPGRNVPPKPPGDNWFWTGSEWIQPYSPIPDVPDKQPFMDFGSTLGGAIGQGVVDGIALRETEVDEALRELASRNPEASRRNSDFRQQTVVPAPNISAVLAAFARVSHGATAVIALLGSAGTDAGRSFTMGLQTSMEAAIRAAQVAAAAIRGVVVGSLASLYGAGFSVGQSLGHGIAVGITSTSGLVNAAVAEIIAGAKRTAQILAEIRSPSGLFAREVGRPIAAGIGLGIEQGAPIAQRSLSSLLGGLGTMSASSSAAYLRNQPTSAAHAGGMYASQITVVYAVKSDEMANLLHQAERGDVAMANWENVSRSFGLVMSGGMA